MDNEVYSFYLYLLVINYITNNKNLYHRTSRIPNKKTHNSKLRTHKSGTWWILKQISMPKFEKIHTVQHDKLEDYLDFGS